MHLKPTLTLFLASAIAALAAPTILLEDSFAAQSPVWKRVECFKPFSLITYTADKGAILSRNEKQQPIPGRLFDTAFMFISKQLPLPKDADSLELRIAVACSKGAISCCPYGDNYHNRISCYDTAGKRIAVLPYSPKFRKEAPLPNRITASIPKGTASIALEFGLDSPNLLSGENITLKDIRLTVGSKAEIDALPASVPLAHGPVITTDMKAYKNGQPIQFAIENAAQADMAALKARLDGKDITVAINGQTATFTPAAPIADGLHDLTITVKDTLDTIPCDYSTIFYLGKAPESAVSVSLRDDGLMIVNGKPFFLLGLACLVKQGRNGYSYENAFKEASEAGINFVRHWSTFNINSHDGKEYHDLARKYNIYVSFSPTLVKNDTDPLRVAKGVLGQMNLDRCLAWDTGDDTASWISPDQLAAKYNAIRAIDTTRLTTQADAILPYAASIGMHSRYRDYVNYSDTFQPEIYPIGNNRKQPETPEMTARMVPTVIRDMKASMQDIKDTATAPKCVWALLQYFHYNKESNNWDRMPTEQELRAMSYLALIHGAKGIYWYRYAGYPKTENEKRGYSDEQWNALKKLSLEFSSVHDLLCERDPRQTQAVKLVAGPAKDGRGYDSVNTLLKEYNGNKYLFVCNSATKPVTASFKVPGIKAATEKFTGAVAAVKDNAFTLELPGYGTALYQLTTGK